MLSAALTLIFQALSLAIGIEAGRRYLQFMLPDGNQEEVKDPLSSLIAVWLTPVATFDKTRLLPGTTAPVASFTEPAILPPNAGLNQCGVRSC